MTDTLLRELINIPESVHRSDFVISLVEGVDQPEKTLNDYEVTPQLVGCFDSALSLVGSSLETRASKGAYLHGSFGSGKSHFMAVLHLLLQGHPAARAVPELAQVVAKHDSRLQGRKFLMVPYHMIGAASMEAGILGGYVDYVRTHHPGTPLPAVYVDDALLADGQKLRERMGDDVFFANLGGGDDEGFGELAAGWDAARFEAALSSSAPSSERAVLVSDLIEAYFNHASVLAESSGRGFVPFDDGLAAISQHAKGLGYDAVILFLDELILWFASRMADPTFVNTEGQKVAKLVEADSSQRPAPIVSFIARQRDLRDFIGQGIPGAERLNFGEILQWWEGRFDTIELADRNLPAIVKKRLLTPKSEAAQQTLDAAFDKLAAGAGRAMDTLMTSEADRAAFRRVYPFSPALVETLVAVSGYLQRERTALRLLLQLLVERRDELSVGDLVPLGDLYDVIRAGEEPFTDELKRHFNRAKTLYEHKIRPMLLGEYGLDEDRARSLPDSHAFRTDDRLVKTLLLAALVPHVEPLRSLTVRRLADLNHGTITTPIPGAEKAAVLGKLRKWAPDIPELRLEGDEQDPTVSLQITGVDVRGIIDQAAAADSAGARRVKIRDLVGAALELEVGGGLTPATYAWVWRGSRRTVDVRFANARDATDIPDSEFKAQGRPRAIIDFPFDEPGYGPNDDLARIEELRTDVGPTSTVCWLPLFLTEEAQERLGTLVILEHILTGDRFDGFTLHLSPQDRLEARNLLKNQAESLRALVADILRQAYGLQDADERWVRTDIPPRDQFPTLDPTLLVRPPTSATFTDAFKGLLDQVMSHLYPAHPEFEDEVRIGDLRTALKHIERAVGERDQRVEIPQPERKAVRKVLGPLKLATTGEAHIVLDRHWRDHFHRKQTEDPGIPVTVERLKAWIDEPKRMGLDDRVANLVVSAYVLQDDRILVLAGQQIQPGVERLDSTAEARTQKLPSSEEWERAKTLAAGIFGLPASPILSASGVGSLVGQLKVEAQKYSGPARELVTGLRQGAAHLEGVDDQSDRLRTAAAAVALLDALLAAEEADAIAVLTGADIPTSGEAIGRSIKSASEVTASLRHVNWELLSSIAKLPGDWGSQGAGVRTRVAETFGHDELSQTIAAVLRDAERAATELLAKAAIKEGPSSSGAGAGGQPGPVSEVPPVTTTLDKSGTRDMARDEIPPVLNELLARSATLRKLKIWWEFED